MTTHTYLEFASAGFGIIVIVSFVFWAVITVAYNMLPHAIGLKKWFIGLVTFYGILCPLVGWLTFKLGVWS